MRSWSKKERGERVQRVVLVGKWVHMGGNNALTALRSIIVEGSLHRS